MAKSVVKRIRISKMQQHMMLSVLAASLIFGVSLVLAIYFFKYIAFNSKVIEAKDGAIDEYYVAIKNVGICEDKNKDGKYDDGELDKCNPDALDVSKLTGTLRYNVMMVMANNTALESVARGSLKECYMNGNVGGTKINFAELYRKATDEAERAYDLSMLKKCSALRVIPDALPAQKNEEALLASLNQIFLLSGWEPEALSPGGSSATSNIKGLSVMPVNLSIEASTLITHTVLSNIEKSIREFDVQTATISWNGNDVNGSAKLELQAQANAYYAETKEAVENTRTIYATQNAKKNAKGNK